MITVACVRTGKKYGVEYVEKLRNMVERHLKVPYKFICLTDQEDTYAGVTNVQIKGLDSWWAKMFLFSPTYRGDSYTIYFDLDMVVCNDITGMASIDADFGICANFTRLAGNLGWPCQFGSCVMTFAPKWGEHVFQQFIQDKHMWMKKAHKYGDQWVIEKLVPDAKVLNFNFGLHPTFFISYRDIRNYPGVKPEGTSVVAFAGRHSPSDCNVPWVKEAWR